MPQRPLNQRDYYTTGEMARAIGCSRQTVIRQIDSGVLAAHRAGGASAGRRVSKVAFRRYLADHGIPDAGLAALEAGAAVAEAFAAGGKTRG